MFSSGQTPGTTREQENNVKKSTVTICILLVAGFVLSGLAVAQFMGGKGSFHPGPNQTAAGKPFKAMENGTMKMDMQGRGGPDFAAAATTLGVTEDALKSALGTGNGQDRPDLATAATTLGVTEDALKSALGTGNGRGHGPCTMDYASIASSLGVSEDAVKSAFSSSGQGRPDFASIAGTLGVTEDALKAAMKPPQPPQTS
jgi:hypothetical protein